MESLYSRLSNTVNQAQQGGGSYTSKYVDPCERLSTIISTLIHALSNSYPTQASGGAAGAGGYQSRRTNPYAQQDDHSYEMSDVKDSTTHLAPTQAAGGGDGMSAFYTEVRLLQNPHCSLRLNLSGRYPLSKTVCARSMIMSRASATSIPVP